MDLGLSSRLRCGDFEVDLKAGEVYSNGQRIRLQAQPLQVLRILIKRAGQVVTRDEIKEALWPHDTIVEFDNAINTAIKKLRLAFADSNKEPRYIETVARRGYRFIMAVEQMQTAGADLRDTMPAVDVPAAEEPVLTTGTLSGRTASHYRVLELIGGGGMGVVYRAEDLRLDRAVALKFLPEEMGDDERAIESFEREARAASALDHPNICSIYEFGEHQGQPFIVMPLLQGQTLRDRLAQGDSGQSARPIAEAIDLGVQIARGLEAAHKKGIIHRDIKPANIFVTTGSMAKILDFGLAKVLDIDTKAGATAQAQPISGIGAAGLATGLSLDRSGPAIGTAGYMSPEQIRREPLDARTDLFSFGLVLYEMATGRRAFSGDTVEEVRDAILHSTPVSAREVNPAVSPKLEAVIRKALAKERQARYQTATDLLADLEALDTRRSRRKAQATKRILARFIAALIVVSGVAAGIAYWRLHRPPILSGKDTVVLADFANTTGDAMFDDSLRQALATQLDQSPYLNVLSDRKLLATLRQMERLPEQAVTPQIATEICLRTHSSAVLAGSIAPASGAYEIVLRALSCQTGDTLTTVKVRARTRNDVLPVLAEAANEMRKGLGESLTSLKNFDQPLPEATTSSLEALQAFSKSKRFPTPTESIPYLKRALELDPNFALAYANLGAAYMNVGEGSLGAQNLRKAYELRERTSQRERFYIEATYYALLTRELDKGRQSAEEWERSYPQDWRPHNDLGVIYAQLGDANKAAAEMQEVIRLAPDNPGAYGNLMGMLSAADRLTEAQAVYEEARQRNLDSPYLRQYKYNLAFLQGDQAGLEEQLQWAAGKPRVEDVFLAAQSDTEAYYGRFSQAREFSRRAVESAKHADADETAASHKADEALREAEMGSPPAARAAAAEALALDHGRDVRMYAALALARAGDISRAQQLLEGLSQEFPLDTLLQNYNLPAIRAAIELQQNKPLNAIETLEVSRPYELSQGSLSYMYPTYLCGEAYLKAGQWEKAAAEFQKTLSHPGIMENFVTGALARLQLARAQASLNHKEEARRSYQEFLKLWQDADADLPIYQQARAEYLRLR